MTKLGEFIKNKRKKLKLTREQLGELAHITDTEVYRIEVGIRKNPSLKTSVDLANALQIPFDELLQNSGFTNL